MKTNIAIVAHKQRRDTARKLAETIDADHIAWDQGGLGAAANHRAAWNWHLHHPADWSIVLEDDSVPCPSFRYQLQQALGNAPTQLVSLYLGQQRPPHWQDIIGKAITRADKARACWITGRHNLHAVALAADRQLVKTVTTALALYGVYPVDEAVSMWTSRNNIDIAYALPSLVNHADDIPSLIQHRDGEPRPPGRVAWRHGTRRRWTPISVPLIAPNRATGAA